MTRSTVIGAGAVLALAGITACGGSSGPRSQSAARTRGTVATVTGPIALRQLRVLRIGSSSARHVLVLLPGTSAGDDPASNDFLATVVPFLERIG